MFNDKLHKANVWHLFCLVSTEASAAAPYGRCCLDRDEMGREQAHGGVVVMQVKEAAEPRKIRSEALQGLLLGNISVQQCQGCLQHGKEEHINEIHC